MVEETSFVSDQFDLGVRFCRLFIYCSGKSYRKQSTRNWKLDIGNTAMAAGRIWIIYYMAFASGCIYKADTLSFSESGYDRSG